MGRPGRLLAAALALLVAGCAGIPTSGPVQRGGDLRLQPQDDAVPFIAEPPQPGASAVDVVRGFLRASADFRGDHEKARLYLAPAVRQDWRPGAATVVYDQAEPPTVEETGAGTVAVRGSEVAQIDTEGSYLRAPEGSVVERSFTMERVAGEWRIAGLQDGLLLSSLDVQETFRQLALYFLSPSLNTVVPDVVLLPQLPGLSTKLVSRLLRGPTAALRGAVGTAFPQGTGLDVQSVSVRDGLATVRLDETALVADDDAREQMSAQIVWTLKQLGPEIQRVRITAGDEDLVTSGVATQQPRDSWATFDPDALPGDASVHLVRAGVLGRLIEGEFQPLVRRGAASGPALRTPAVSLDASRVAAVTADGTTLLAGRVAAADELEPVATGTDLSRPSWDPLDNLWFVDRATGELQVLPAGGTRPLPVTVPNLPGGALSAVVVSRDGSRVALVSGSGRAGRLVVGGVTGADELAGDESTPGSVAVTVGREILPELLGVRDVAWADATTLVTLGSRDGLPPRTLFVSVDGYQVDELEPLDRLVRLAAAPQGSPLVGSTADGRLVQFSSGRGWVALGEGADPAYPG